MNSKPFTFDRVVRMLIGIGIVIAVFFLLKRLSGVLLPFFVAWLLAYLLHPIVSFFQYRLKFKSRALSIATVLLLFIGGITGVVMLLLPTVNNEIQKATILIMNYSENMNLNSVLPRPWQIMLQNYFSQMNIQSILHDQTIMDALKKMVPQIWNIVNSSLDLVLGIAMVMVIFLYLVFILLDFEHITSGMFSIIPPKYQKLFREIIEDLEAGMNSYFRGQALIALIVGVLFAIGFSIIQLPLAILLGLFIGLLSLIPYLKVVGILPAFALALLRSVETGQHLGSVLLSVGIVFAVIQVVEDFVLIPRIMKKATGLNPAIIMLSLSIWGALIGIVGMIIALPLTTLIISYYKRFVLGDAADEIEKHDTVAPAEQSDSDI